LKEIAGIPAEKEVFACCLQAVVDTRRGRGEGG